MRISLRLGLILAIAAASLFVGCDNILLKNNASLSSLTIQSDTGAALVLDPAFAPLQLNYAATVDNATTKLTITAKSTSADATIGITVTTTGTSTETVSGTGSVTGDRVIVSDNTEIDVYVTAANMEKTLQKYIVIVTRASK
jgi:hypothetical protein